MWGLKMKVHTGYNRRKGTAMKTTGFKAAVGLLVVMVMTGLAVAGWGGGRGRFGPGPGPAVQDNNDEQGPWFQRGLGRGAPDDEIGQGGPRRGLREPDAIPPRLRGQRQGRGWGDGPGPGARNGRGGRGCRYPGERAR